jgi:hypothetical protein
MGWAPYGLEEIRFDHHHSTLQGQLEESCQDKHAGRCAGSSLCGPTLNIIASPRSRWALAPHRAPSPSTLSTATAPARQATKRGFPHLYQSYGSTKEQAHIGPRSLGTGLPACMYINSI